MDKNYLDENAKSQVSPPATKRKRLSKAAKERRRIKKLQRQYPTGIFSQIGSDPEPSFPNLSPEANAYLLNELRRKFRSGKTTYGKHMAKSFMKIFGSLPNSEPAELENWINWLCRNREELISGKYSPSRLNDASQSSTARSAGSDDGNSIPSAFSDMHDQLSDFGNDPKNLAITDKAPIPMGKSSLPGQDHDQVTNNLTAAEDVKCFETTPIPTVNHDRRAENFYKASEEIPNQAANHASRDSADQPHIENPEDAAIIEVPTMPDKPDFYPQMKGASKANSFFYKVYEGKSLEQIREKAVVLASDKAAVEEVLNRGPTERAYLIKAMRDLKVPLP